jgi:hypothetical protein
MIHVDPQPEPPVFAIRVRRPGRRFLRNYPHPTSKQFASHSYWRGILDLLHEAYNGICAYSCHWIPYDTGCDTVEHFLPKTRHPRQAYEWSNYRLVCGTLNGRKGERRDVLDPFLINNGDFILKFPSLMVDPSPNLSKRMQARVSRTITRLGLNDEGTCLKSRVKWVSDYCDDHITFEHLRIHAPFIALELERQNLTAHVKAMMHAQP